MATAVAVVKVSFFWGGGQGSYGPSFNVRVAVEIDAMGEIPMEIRSHLPLAGQPFDETWGGRVARLRVLDNEYGPYPTWAACVAAAEAAIARIAAEAAAIRADRAARGEIPADIEREIDL